MLVSSVFFSYFFFNDTATTEIYTLSLHDALPISTSRPTERPKRRSSSATSSSRSSATSRRSHLGWPAPTSEASAQRSEEHTSELQSPDHLVCRLLLEKKKKKTAKTHTDDIHQVAS